jgi:hypothetical protein
MATGPARRWLNYEGRADSQPSAGEAEVLGPRSCHTRLTGGELEMSGRRCVLECGDSIPLPEHSTMATALLGSRPPPPCSRGSGGQSPWTHDALMR